MILHLMRDSYLNLFRIWVNKTNALDLHVVGNIDMDDMDMDMDDIYADEQFDIDNPDYICEHWYDILEQSYNLVIDLDADVGYESNEDVMDDVMVDLAIFEMELKLMGM